MAAATRSIICSRTTVSISHGPRYEHRPHVFVYTAVAEYDTLGMRYGPVKSMPTNPPELLPAAGNAPTSSSRCARTAMIRPPSSTAQLTVILSSRACCPARRFSRRSSIHLTGRPSRLPATTTATSSGSMNIFCPKPPPTSCMTTRTRFSGSPTAHDRNPLTPWGPWVEVCTSSSCRYGSQLDTTPRHSMGTHR